VRVLALFNKAEISAALFKNTKRKKKLVTPEARKSHVFWE